jgi:ABC-2 type transport system permease protein
VVRGVLAGVRLQLILYRQYPDSFIPLMTAPLYTIIFVMIVRHGGRADLSGYAVVAPAFISLWWFALFHGGLVVNSDRWSQTLELHVAAPTSFPAVIFGRILTVTLVGQLSFVEVWLVGKYLLRTPIAIQHPGVLTATLLATAFAMAATALFMACLFVLVRNAFTMTNSISYPFYVLGGILVPVALLPGFVQPVSRLVFLSWSADLLRASLSAAPVADVGFRLAMIVLLGAAGFAVAADLMRRVVQRVRNTGELGLR